MIMRYGSTPADGGAVFVKGEGQFSSCSFYMNIAPVGGAICAAQGSKLTVTSCTFENNTATQYCGGIGVVQAQSASISGCIIILNEAYGQGAGWGGGVFVDSCPNFSIASTDISQNWALNYGGGIYALNTALTMTSGQLQQNSCGWLGGGIYVDADDKTVRLENVSVTDNSSDAGGGAYVTKGTLAGSLTALTGNVAGARIPGIAYKPGAAAPITVPVNQQTKVQDN